MILLRATAANRQSVGLGPHLQRVAGDPLQSTVRPEDGFPLPSPTRSGVQQMCLPGLDGRVEGFNQAGQSRFRRESAQDAPARRLTQTLPVLRIA